ncbi:chaperonin-like RBCX protein 1, chloroplastic [Elaeis guineensis]|uniref:Chaperonin-like RBCX protein 1, chloroplastic n=1 Tax=Elaeis guineensis var. tenera TaxID=51953 RepID=A0A6I9QQG0_ELAGV|nr:chaperonin-like RBCX protein 1, chloroplastic [Elaeis guineensis]
MECCYWAPSRLPPAFSHSFSRGSGTERCYWTSPTIWRLRKRQRAYTGYDVPRCQKMFVPGFGEASPEAKAARNLQNFFTYIAVKIVLAQLESYNPEAYSELMEFISRNSLNDGDKFCGRLMRESSRHQGLALRILEVRSAYSKRDFEWENLKKLAFKMVDESNTRLMRDYVLETSHMENEG